jgi:hypothetical protein
MNSLAANFSSSDRTHQFRLIADRICSLVSSHSVRLVAYNSPELPLYSALPPSKQAEILDQLKVFQRTIEVTLSNGDSLENVGRSVWHALSTLGFVPPSDIFSKIGNDDVVEIYDLQNIQLWRNFNFLKICSYTIEEMYSVDWPSRYSRDPAMNSECIAKVTSLLTGETPDVYYAGIREHVLEETLSAERLVLQASHDWFARLKNQRGELTAWLVTSKVKIFGKGLPLDLGPRIQIAPLYSI